MTCNRAVKFIRDQAEATLATSNETSSKRPRALSTAHLAAHAIRKILTGDKSDPSLPDSAEEEPASEVPGRVNPLSGWSDGVSLRKSHCCLLLKPQFVLRSEDVKEESCVVAAVQAKLLSFGIMDDANIDDPINGKVMSR